jgi:Uma2 family endonuclease
MTTTTIGQNASMDLGENSDRYEVVNGQRVEMPRMGAFEGVLANVLCWHLASYCQSSRVGWPFVEILFLLDAASGLKRRPDVAFVSHERWPEGKPVSSDDAWNVVPDLAVEVVSPTNSATEIAQKVQDFLRCGVRLVWVVYPRQDEVYVYDSSSHAKILHHTDELDGGSVLPGFWLPLAKFFTREGASG